jgi:hypothetical protein
MNPDYRYINIIGMCIIIVNLMKNPRNNFMEKDLDMSSSYFYQTDKLIINSA